MLIFPCFSMVVNSTYLSDGSFGVTVSVSSGDVVCHTIDSGSFGAMVNIEYYTWSDWSNWWVMDYIPSDFVAPSSFSVVNFSSTSINVTWVKNSNASHTFIVRKIDSIPSSRDDGTMVYNDTGSSYNDTGLDESIHYFYRAWSYNSSTNSFSFVSSSDDCYTNPGNPNDLQDTSSSIDTISMSWTKGNNATRTVVFMNATGEAGYPNRDNGTEVINTTGSSGTVSDLTDNVTFYFTAFSFNPVSGLWSIGNDTDTASTLSVADAPTNFVINRFDDVQLNLSWTKSNPVHDTVIVRKTGSYPDNVYDGTEVYNGSFSSYKDTGLTPATKYFYRAWGWNGEEYSNNSASASNITRPSPPQSFTGSIDGVELDITWSKGTGATRTVIKNNTGSYPSFTTGYLVYNDTGSSTTVNNVVSIEYYTGWSFCIVSGEEIFSLPTNLLYGGLEIKVYKEDESWIAIGNYSVFITNSDASETYSNTSQNNPFRVDVGDVPNGEDITIQISKQGYKTRSQVMDLFENTYYTLNFFLAASGDGSPSGESGEPWFVNASDSDNETFASHYIIIVENTLGESVKDACVTIQRYINATANDSDFDDYDTILIDYTDSSGQVEVDLIPDTVYYVLITKSGYQNMSAFWTPSEISYVEDAYKTFKLIFSQDDIDIITLGDCISLNASWVNSSGYLHVYYSDICTGTNDVSFYIYEKGNFTSTLMNVTNHSSNVLDFIVSGLNSSRSYSVKMFLNHSDIGFNTLTIYVNPFSDLVDENILEERFTDVFGPFDLGWVKTFLIFLPCIVLLIIFGIGHVGMGVVSSGFWLGFSALFIDVSHTVEYGSIAAVLVVAGVVYIVATKGRHVL